MIYFSFILTAPSRWYHFGKVAEWIVRKKKSFSESYYFRKVTTNASPKQLVRHLRNLTTGQPQAPGDTIGNYHSRVCDVLISHKSHTF